MGGKSYEIKASDVKSQLGIQKLITLSNLGNSIKQINKYIWWVDKRELTKAENEKP